MLREVADLFCTLPFRLLTPDLSTVDLPLVAEGCPKEVPGLAASLFTLSAPVELLAEGLWVTDSVLRVVLAVLR